jgi:hypothetical protein
MARCDHKFVGSNVCLKCGKVEYRHVRAAIDLWRELSNLRGATPVVHEHLAWALAQAEARGAQGRAGGEEEQRWHPTSETTPEALSGQWWIQFDDGSVARRVAVRSRGSWWYGFGEHDREHAPVIAYCKAEPPAPPSPTPEAT